MTDTISPRAFHASDGVEDWRVLGEGACAFFRTGSFAAGAGLVQAISEITGLDDDHPDVDVRSDGVVVRLVHASSDHFGLVPRHVELARQISAVARELDAPAEPGRLHTVQLSVDAMVIPKVLPFWRAVLGYVARADSPEEDAVDPLGRGAPLWFQQMGDPRPQRNRLHVDVWVPHDEADARVAAALAAGGHLVTDAHAPSWWTLADSEDNEVDVCTWQPSLQGRADA
ncbi:VOC family protein [Actinotalea solisilvae]|uniref:VOC family protein n=1 Tax=Actinotalea solisilvae TaxID=2072922 RepID=UPI0018F18F9E|nr:VOC family protein [Actinotalea solisilvae]